MVFLQLNPSYLRQFFKSRLWNLVVNDDFSETIFDFMLTKTVFKTVLNFIDIVLRLSTHESTFAPWSHSIALHFATTCNNHIWFTLPHFMSLSSVCDNASFYFLVSTQLCFALLEWLVRLKILTLVLNMKGKVNCSCFYGDFVWLDNLVCSSILWKCDWIIESILFG